MKLDLLVRGQLLVTGPARPRGIAEQARVARMVRACVDGPVFRGDRVRWDEVEPGLRVGSA